MWMARKVQKNKNPLQERGLQDLKTIPERLKTL
jgi:hypothetical protein